MGRNWFNEEDTHGNNIIFTSSRPITAVMKLSRYTITNNISDHVQMKYDARTRIRIELDSV